ncbi:hypothetical protein KCP91_08070 [Microvirga sp. SRT01]|uniref:Uncharacterized protein n=1 Tax=Sphingomonas longa TaxID=2778730 RepID=A0ABS2D5Y7_9SPHN|nr:MULTISPECIES: hypothetical protein [Alphaproteobacteria]MBM6576326.1 hypothetical protein [Sphingomonas sp. BT552]MBR7709372.1 hypothetical protein [Microvirga sp. SRT01]
MTFRAVLLLRTPHLLVWTLLLISSNSMAVEMKRRSEVALAKPAKAISVPEKPTSAVVGPLWRDTATTSSGADHVDLKPCKAGQDNRASDLCAQWKAADAAELSAVWTRNTFWVGLLGSVIAFVTLMAAVAAALYAKAASAEAARSNRLTMLENRRIRREAYEAADRNERSLRAAEGSAEASRLQNKLSKDALVLTERAYITQSKHMVTSRVSPEGEIVAIDLSVHWTNEGNTPAIDTASNLNWRLWPEPLHKDFDFPEVVKDRYGIRSVVGPTMFRPSYSVELFRDTLIAIANGSLFFYVWGWMEYHDVFEGTPRHRTEFAFQVLVNTEKMPREVTITIVNLPAYNGMDDFCYKDIITASGRDIADNAQGPN